MANYSEDYQTELSDIYGQAEANAAEENAVELLNVLRDIVATHPQKYTAKSKLEAAELLIERIENIAHREAGML